MQSMIRTLLLLVFSTLTFSSLTLSNVEQSQAKPKRAATNSPPKDYRGLSTFAKDRGFTVTSTTGGKHNPNSAHYQGRAIDVRTRDKTPQQVNQFIRDAKSAGIQVRDERTRPSGQKVYSGPHIHLQVPKKSK